MKLQTFSIYDSKAKAYLPPWYMHNTDMALRVFADCCNATDHQFSKNPEDYTLFHIGEFDDESGKITPDTPKSIANGITVLKPVYADDQKDLFEDEPKGSPDAWREKHGKAT